jgi:hypothetical protein
MSSMSWLFTNGAETPATPATSAERITDHRARLALEERERAEQRRLELAELRSSQNPPDVRIRTWEKLHGLRMPADASHPILDVIAVSTRLSLAEVQQEQRARSARQAANAQKQRADAAERD